MIRSNILNNKVLEVEPNDTKQVGHNKFTGYSAQAYSHTITIHHDNVKAIPSSVGVYEFLSNALSKLTLQIGAGNEIYDLNLIAHLVRQIDVRKQLIYSIDRTQGNGKVSTVELIIDFLSLGFFRPQDTILFNTGGYDHLLTQVVANTGLEIENCTVKKTNVRITEVLKTNVQLPVIGGKQLPAQNKKGVHKTKPYAVSEQGMTLDIEDNLSISKIIMYVTDGNKIVKDKIKHITIKNAIRTHMEVDSATLERWNRELLKNPSNTNYDGILCLNIAQGEYTQNLVTTGSFKDSKLILDIEVDGAEKPVLNVIYETVENA